MQQYAQALLRAIQSTDGATVAGLLDICSPAAQARAQGLLAGAGVSARGGGAPPPPAVAASVVEHLRRVSALRDGWERVAACCLCAAGALQAAGGACDVLVLAYTRDALQESAFQQVLQDAAGNWIVAPLLRLVADCLAICAAPGCFPTRLDRDRELQALVDPVRNLFNFCINDKSTDVFTDSKRTGSLAAANLLLKLNFRLNVPKQCTFVLQPLQRSILGDPQRLAAFPTAQVVTLKYYMGRLNMYDDKYSDAEADLFYAFRHCHSGPRYHSQRRRILEALIPVRLMLGLLPSQRLLAEYGFEAQYSGIVAGLRQGNIPAYRSALEEHMEAFIASGVYLTLDKLQLYVLRTLIKRL